MKSIKYLALALCLGAMPVAMGQSLTLDASQSNDLRASTLMSAPAMPLTNTRQETVQFSYPVAADHRNERALPEPVHSRTFETWVSPAQFARGVPLRVDAPGAVVRVSMHSADAALSLDALALATSNGRTMSARAASDQLVSGDDLRAAGLGGDGRTLGFRLAPELGAGEFVLRSDTPLKTRVLVSVLDRNSDTTLALRAQAHQVLAGSAATTRVAFAGGATKATPANVSGYAVAPDGARHRVAFSDGKEAVEAQLVTGANHPGLWEVHVRAETSDGLIRDAKTVFAVSVPVARLDDSLTVSLTGQTLDATLGLQAASAGRYEISGTLMATDRDGVLRPAMLGAAATWLEAGSGTLTLSFDAQQLKAQGVGAPFALRDVMLRDQSRMAVMETRARAAHIR